jgi:hypothetical protein
MAEDRWSLIAYQYGGKLQFAPSGERRRIWSLLTRPTVSKPPGSSNCAMYDRRPIGLVLIGMPGLQRRLARYAQLYSRVGFVHQFLPLGGAELQHIIQRQSQQLGVGLELYGGTDAGILSSIMRITGGNFRLVERLFAQIQRVAQINQLATLTPELVEMAQESLVIGTIRPAICLFAGYVPAIKSSFDI